MSVTKRFFFYLLSLVTLGMFATGVGTLIRLVFDLLVQNTATQVGSTGFTGQTFSLGLALLIIGGTLWYVFWRTVQKAASGNTEETGSALRKWYLNIIMVVSLFVALSTATSFLRWLMEGAPRIQFSSIGLATLIVAIVIWYYHRRVEKQEGQPSPVAKTLHRWYIYIFCAYGLGWMATSIVQFIYHAFVSIPIWGATVSSSFWDFSVAENIAGIILGGFVWGFHWFKLAKEDTESTLRQVYLYLLTIMGSVLAGLAALLSLLDRLFRFGFGSLTTPSATYFQFLGWTIPTILVAATIWMYHRKVIQEETSQIPRMRFSARHIYSYLMSLIGLGALVAGVILLFGILLDLLKNAMTSAAVVVGAGGGTWRELLSLSLAFLIVATPMWLYYWNNVIKMVAAGGVEERSARTRRVYLYFILAAAVIALAAALINVVFRVLNGLIQGQFGVNVFKQIIWSVQIIIVAVPLLLYHWKVLRSDQRLGAESLITKKKVVSIIAGDGMADFIFKIEDRLGYKVHLLSYKGQTPEIAPLPDEEINSIVDAIQSASTTKVMLVITGHGVQVLPYEEK